MMKYQTHSVLLRLFLTLCIIFPLADGTVHAIAHPYKIDTGLTSTLTVNCTFTDVAHSDIKHPVSLVVSFANDTYRYQTSGQLAFVNLYSDAQVNQLSPDGNPTVSGSLKNNGDSFLALVWKRPMIHQAGTYKCSLIGLNNASRVEIKEETVEVTAQPPGVDSLVREIVELRHRVNDMETIQEKTQGKMNRAATAMFIFSQVFDGRRYYLSRKGVDNKIHTAEGLCEIFGGYLAEITTQSEYRFVQSFIGKYSGITAVYIGGTDEAREGHFVFQHSKRPVAFKDWGRHQPNNKNGNQDCMVLWLDYHWSMADENCYDESTSRRFLCEVPMS